MRAEIEAAFPICVANHCVAETTTNPILIQDSKTGKCVIINTAADAHFTVKNTTGKNITFVAIDKCIWNDQSGHKKCDFAVTDSKAFVFVEVKDTDNRSTEHKKTAKEQLEETIKRFTAVISFKDILIHAVISWKYLPTRPLASTLMQSAKVHFWDTYQTELLEGNEMSF